MPELEGCCLFFWLLGRGAVVLGFLHSSSACFGGSGGGVRVDVRVFPEFPLLVPFIVLLPLSVSALAY